MTPLIASSTADRKPFPGQRLGRMDSACPLPKARACPQRMCFPFNYLCFWAQEPPSCWTEASAQTAPTAPWLPELRDWTPAWPQQGPRDAHLWPGLHPSSVQPQSVPGPRKHVRPLHTCQDAGLGRDRWPLWPQASLLAYARCAGFHVAFFGVAVIGGGASTTPDIKCERRNLERRGWGTPTWQGQPSHLSPDQGVTSFWNVASGLWSPPEAFPSAGRLNSETAGLGRSLYRCVALHASRVLCRYLLGCIEDLRLLYFLAEAPGICRRLPF